MADHMEIDGVAAAAEVTPPQHDAAEATPEAGHSHTHSHTHIHDQPHIQDDPLAKQRFEVKKWTAVAFWSWDIVVETCAICRNHLMEPCIECQPNTLNKTNEECIAAWGVCNHAFHLHCITRWLKLRYVCPLDNREWTFQKFGN